jgi:hypothetical protein
MSVASNFALSVNALPELSIFFAKEPTPAADPNQSDMEKTVVLGPSGKKGPTPPNIKERILFLVLVLIIVTGGGYLAVNPEVLMDLLGDAPGEAPPPPKPRVAKPVAPAPTQTPVSAPAPAPVQPAAPGAAPVPAQPTAMAPAAVPAAQAPAPVPVVPAAPMSVPTAAAPKPVTPAPVPAVVASVPAPAPAPAISIVAPKPAASSAIPSIPTPKFGEGEKVSVSAPTPLTADAAGKKPGTASAAPGSTLVVLDADLQNYAWVYSVRTEQGATGWVAEKNLVAK